MDELAQFAIAFVKSGVVPPPMPAGGGAPPGGGMDMAALLGGGMPPGMPPGAPPGMPPGPPPGDIGAMLQGMPPPPGGPGGMPGEAMPPPGGPGGAPGEAAPPPEPPPETPAPAETAAAGEAPSRRVSITTVFAEVVKVRKLLQGLYRQMNLPIPEDVLNDEDIVAPGVIKPKRPSPKPPEEEPAKKEEEEGAPEAQLPGIGKAPPVKPIKPPI